MGYELAVSYLEIYNHTLSMLILNQTSRSLLNVTTNSMCESYVIDRTNRGRSRSLCRIVASLECIRQEIDDWIHFQQYFTSRFSENPKMKIDVTDGSQRKRRGGISDCTCHESPLLEISGYCN